MFCRPPSGFRFHLRGELSIFASSSSRDCKHFFTSAFAATIAEDGTFERGPQGQRSLSPSFFRKNFRIDIVGYPLLIPILTSHAVFDHTHFISDFILADSFFCGSGGFAKTAKFAKFAPLRIYQLYNIRVCLCSVVNTNTFAVLD